MILDIHSSSTTHDTLKLFSILYNQSWMSAVAERLNFSIVQGAAFPFLGVSIRGGMTAVAVLGKTAVVCPASLLKEGGGRRRSKLGTVIAPVCIALARFCNSGPVIKNLSSSKGFFMSVAACVLAVFVVLAAAAVFCTTVAGSERLGTTHEIAGAVVDICCSVVVSAANTCG